ncbi:LOW QUALITY PROTEIN: hypothetical protein BCh11DRAFT_05854 [Burkholderia sp. Ch1-1]|nr:LOW QUALITY PROTEIN: hypothetical protein BCh11DRAFT_05854 [Burkholderia sp. Ch1-1]
MKKLTALIVSALLLAAGSFFQQTASADDNISADVNTKAFYAWYIKSQSADTYPLLNKGVYAYVAKGTVDRLRDAYLRNRLPGDTDYFTKVQDHDASDWTDHIATHAPVMLGEVAVVPVTFGSRDRISVLVFLRKEARGWKITKVDDTLDYH